MVAETVRYKARKTPMTGKHQGDKPTSKPFKAPKPDKSTGDGDGGGGRHEGGDPKKGK
jgi:hypothetical protein